MIIFKCEHCDVEKEYDLSRASSIARETRKIKTFSVCMDCSAEYNQIAVLVKEFAAEKQLELEDTFFKVMTVEEPEPEEEEDEKQ